MGHYKRGIGIGLQVMGGNIGGIVASNAYRVRDAPRYLPGRASKPFLLAPPHSQLTVLP